MAARNVPVPTDFACLRSNLGLLDVSITDPASTGTYRVALRDLDLDWDTVYTLVGMSSTFPAPASGPLFVSVAAVDAEGGESLFSGEKLVFITGTEEAPSEQVAKNITLFQNRPNPFDEATWISFWVNAVPEHREAHILITDLNGRTVQNIPVEIRQGLNELLYTHGYGVRGTFSYTLLVDGHAIDSRMMVFAY